jgi:hypothetical protein
MLLAAINSLNLGVQIIDLGIASDKPDDLEQRMIDVRAVRCLTRDTRALTCLCRD